MPDVLFFTWAYESLGNVHANKKKAHKKKCWHVVTHDCFILDFCAYFVVLDYKLLSPLNDFLIFPILVMPERGKIVVFKNFPLCTLPVSRQQAQQLIETSSQTQQETSP